MYWLFECMTLAALVALVAGLLFTVSTVWILAWEAVAAVQRVLRKAAATGGAEEVLMSS